MTLTILFGRTASAQSPGMKSATQTRGAKAPIVAENILNADILLNGNNISIV